MTQLKRIEDFAEQSETELKLKHDITFMIGKAYIELIENPYFSLNKAHKIHRRCVELHDAISLGEISKSSANSEFEAIKLDFAEYCNPDC